MAYNGGDRYFAPRGEGNVPLAANQNLNPVLPRMNLQQPRQARQAIDLDHAQRLHSELAEASQHIQTYERNIGHLQPGSALYQDYSRDIVRIAQRVEEIRQQLGDEQLRWNF
ncbi:hypothetical protein [Pseudomonas fakonensis]|uniref:hypothetical protein n=1 Tax=Pseudomonas fakonensis TaxID=2842355 RepID=UPI001CEC0C28|nr:hypothetical protein [Pseudomonas fakonensis]